MKKLFAVLAATLLVGSLTAVSFASEEQSAMGKPKAAAEALKPHVKRERTTRITATVEAIDQEKRIVTLKGPDGKISDFKAGPQVRNLPQVKVGDLVDITYYESIAVKVFKPGEMPHGSKVSVAAERLAKPGEKPAGMAGSEVTLTAVVEAISPDKSSVTLKMSDGKSKVVKVREKKNLDNVKVGDEVMITATETLAISVKPAKK